jgi:hypothetical protein
VNELLVLGQRANQRVFLGEVEAGLRGQVTLDQLPQRPQPVSAVALGRIRRIGDQATRWAEGMLQARGVEGLRVLQGLLSLTKRYAAAQLERACGIAHSYGAYRLRTLRQLIERDLPAQPSFDFAQEHPLIRPLSEYQQFVHDAFQKGASS